MAATVGRTIIACQCMSISPGISVGTQFSADLAAQVGLPKEPAKYEVYIESNGVRSNTVTIEVQAAR